LIELKDEKDRRRIGVFDTVFRRSTFVGRQGNRMPSLDDVYRKFGEASEAAQLLETELGTMLLMIGAIEADLIENPDSERATEIYRRINRHTLGQLIKNLGRAADSVAHLEALLSRALAVRNRLSHSFYLRHNFRRNSEEGRAIMMDDLDSMHSKLLEAYKAVMLLSGVDLDRVVVETLPTGHLPI